eukprot:CAMPEP_0170199754 /NCGR_PEP_ID=MMETSP0040_2-20121228/69510_1 /TAXON_ID=641309 /ORGANISM="Lotharella oceanica, Strain CCMP622" /LENGTH=77 /DNA_ID=CAMNT_0010449899 /DNA_START=1069 /DNA_END=1303 /DNA_ORIENTATION=+
MPSVKDPEIQALLPKAKEELAKEIQTYADACKAKGIRAMEVGKMLVWFECKQPEPEDDKKAHYLKAMKGTILKELKT